MLPPLPRRLEISFQNLANLSSEPPVNFINFVKSDNSLLMRIVLAILSMQCRSFGFLNLRNRAGITGFTASDITGVETKGYKDFYACAVASFNAILRN